MSFSIKAIEEGELDRIAAFFQEYRDAGESSITFGNSDAGEISARLRHRLARSPFRRADLPLGLCARNGTGEVTGALLIYPWRFLRGDGVFQGLGAGAFLVAPEVRMLGGLLFRRFLELDQGDFWYAATCNSKSAPLWIGSNCPGIPTSQDKHLFPLRLGSIAQEVWLRRGFPSSFGSLATGVGNLANPILRLLSAKSGLDVQKCDDWDRLAAIAEQNRDPRYYVCDRSGAYLQWRYGTPDYETHTPGVYLFPTPSGQSGWFSLGYGPKGRAGQIRTANLLDWSIPKGFDFGRVVRAAIEVARAERADTLTVNGRSDLPELLPRSINRRRDMPRAFVQSRKIDLQVLTENLVIGSADLF